MINFEKICRTCSSEGQLLSLFIEEPIPLADMLNQIVDFKVNKNDKFPQNICTCCLGKLKSAYCFVQQCQDVNTKLKEYVATDIKLEENYDEIKIETDSIEVCSEFVNTDNIRKEESSEMKCELVEECNNREFELDGGKNIKLDKSDKNTKIKKRRKRSKAPHKFVECNICLKSMHECNLPRHLRTHNGERPYVCSICDKGFVQRFSLDVHMRKHTGETPYKCNHCEKSYKQSTHLLTHIKCKHTAEIQPSANGEFECKICNEKFSKQSILVSHKMFHKKGTTKLYNTNKDKLCNYCGKAFSLNYQLREHIYTHTGEKPYKCENCDKSFTALSLLYGHRQIHVTEKPYKCRFCEKSFAIKCGLKNHELTHTGDKPFKCEICNQSFRQVAHLKSHSFTHTGEKQHKCKYCDKSFALKYNLTVHMRMHTGETPYVCSICNKGFYDSSSMKRHKRKHLLPETNETEQASNFKVENLSSDDSNDGCETEDFPKFLEYVSVKDENSPPQTDLITDDNLRSIKYESDNESIEVDLSATKSDSEVIRTSEKSNLVKEKRVHNGEKSYLCETCGKTFYRKQHLIKHTRIHTGEKPFSCDICKKTFTQQYILVEHKRIHTGEKLYLCDVCDKTFTHQTSLIQHKRIHTGEKRFACDVCEKTFANQSGLVQHKRTHTGDKPYSCDICAKTFTQQGSLVKHKRSHAKEKQFRCDACDKTFNQQRCLNKHARIHAGEKPFSCEICHKAFPTNYNLVRHKRIHNGKKNMKIEMNFENICRTCSLEGDLQSLFNADTLSISDMLTEIVDIKVMKNDKYPQNICSYCLEKLKSAYFFKKQCQEVNEKFEKYLNANENLIDSVKVENLFNDSNDDEWNDDEDEFKLILEDASIKDERSPILSPASNRKKPRKRKIRNKYKKRIETSENGQFQCDKCNIKFETSENLHAHKITHNEKSYLCNHCGKELSSLIGLKAHIRTHTGEKPYKCNICEKSFSSDSVLIVHTRTHLGERPYKCTICEKSFSQIATLNRHKLIHTGDKPYKCDICDQSFRQIPHLKYHSLTHSGEKPCKCTVCEKKFTNSSVLTKHMRIHTGEKPYKCTTCDKTFRHLTSLYKHKSVHTDERPFTCNICNKSFKQKNHLKYHCQTHTGEKPYKCTICSKQFSLNGTLTVHMRIHTGVVGNGGNNGNDTQMEQTLDSNQTV
ncbi:zinc finger protein 184-like [Chrysoperla carnea]|uniref:zinc finger protein 184-like n=1 Tax=Chrysoperla carnea TaxID=189513 RepID=UPI001D084924|nr:zinc finger protein 184-like [Chrysoperla carnea]